MNAIRYKDHYPFVREFAEGQIGGRKLQISDDPLIF